MKRYRRIRWWWRVGLLLLIVAEPARACTTFCLTNAGRPVFGRNFDYYMGGGLVFVNKRGVEKVAMTSGRPAEWVSKYGSVTFNLYGCELPMGGMNEGGLVVENMWLDETVYPEPNSTPAVNNLQWIQYQLDNYRTVSEVVANAGKIRIHPDSAAKVHYLIADEKSDCAVVEYIGGELTIYRAEDLPTLALTNSTYEASVDFLRRYDGVGIGSDGSSLGRFVAAAHAVEIFDKATVDETIDYAFGVLERVRVEDATRWSIVYDISRRQIQFVTMENRSKRRIDLPAFDFSCKLPILMYDLSSSSAGDVSTDFEHYRYERNRKLIMRAFKNSDFLGRISKATLDRLARYPERLTCTE